jgi:hypothetical protein
MPLLALPFTVPVLFAIGLTIAMTIVAILTWFFHDRKHDELEQWVQYGFSRETLRHALLYYRSMATSMLVFLVLFVISCLMLQAEGAALFWDHARQPTAGGPVGTTVFAIDLVLRGGFFDIMEHFDLSVTQLQMNRQNRWFVWYCFAFRMYYGLTLIRIAFSFAWIWAKIHAARRGDRSLAEPAQIPLRRTRFIRRRTANSDTTP